MVRLTRALSLRNSTCAIKQEVSGHGRPESPKRGRTTSGLGLQSRRCYDKHGQAKRTGIGFSSLTLQTLLRACGDAFNRAVPHALFCAIFRRGIGTGGVYIGLAHFDRLSFPQASQENLLPTTRATGNEIRHISKERPYHNEHPGKESSRRLGDGPASGGQSCDWTRLANANR